MQALKATMPASFLHLFDLKTSEGPVIFSRYNVFTATVCSVSNEFLLRLPIWESCGVLRESEFLRSYLQGIYFPPISRSCN